MKLFYIALFGLGASFLPIWKVPGRKGGHNLWLMIGGFQHGLEHIPVDQARKEASFLYSQKGSSNQPRLVPSRIRPRVGNEL